MINNGADQTVQMQRLVYVFVVCMQQRRVIIRDIGFLHHNWANLGNLSLGSANMYGLNETAYLQRLARVLFLVT